jgi:hypothetical protein
MTLDDGTVHRADFVGEDHQFISRFHLIQVNIDKSMAMTPVSL